MDGPAGEYRVDLDRPELLRVDADGGLHLTVAVGGRFGVFIKTDKANFNQLFQVLVGQPAAPAAARGS